MAVGSDVRNRDRRHEDDARVEWAEEALTKRDSKMHSRPVSPCPPAPAHLTSGFRVLLIHLVPGAFLGKVHRMREGTIDLEGLYPQVLATVAPL